MIVCTECLVEMRCSRTGVVLLWFSDHGRKGDEYECPSCHKRAIHANQHSYRVTPVELQHADESGKLRRMV